MTERPPIAILWSTLGPYHVARIAAFAAALRSSGRRLYVCRMAEHSATYAWEPQALDNVSVHTLSDQEDGSVWNASKIAWNFFRFLRGNRIGVVFLPSFFPVPNMLCLLAAKAAGCRLVLMTESWGETGQSGQSYLLVKRALLRQCHAALVGGTLQKEYMLNLGMPRDAIFLGYDVVDVGYFRAESARWRNLAAGDIPVVLPPRYILSLGRFVAKKNLPCLIQAYAQLIRTSPHRDVTLVFVGEGELQTALELEAKNAGLPVAHGHAGRGLELPQPGVVFYPFQQIALLPLFYAKCEVFVLPSSIEEWGLVVNEAMACAVPVIVSKNVGCGRDLVVEAETGFTFDPTSSDQLAHCLDTILSDRSRRAAMAANCQAKIADWGLEKFASGALAALAVCAK